MAARNAVARLSSASLPSIKVLALAERLGVSVDIARRVHQDRLATALERLVTIVDEVRAAIEGAIDDATKALVPGPAAELPADEEPTR